MRFGIIGAAGYIAPRHMKAIVDTGGEIVSACDISDSVGVLDRFAPDCRFTCVPGTFFQDLDDVDVVTVCTPNHLHPVHALQALEAGCDVVLEKPLATCGKGINSATGLIERSRDLPGKIYPVVQLRYNEAVMRWRKQILEDPNSHHVCTVDYSAYRGPWYDASWKGREAESGGLLVNLGIHLFDLCIYMFGEAEKIHSAKISRRVASGSFRCKHAEVRWRLSSEERDSRRVFLIDEEEIDLSNQISELHHKVYEELLLGNSFDLTEASRALSLVDRIKKIGRDDEIVPQPDTYPRYRVIS